MSPDEICMARFGLDKRAMLFKLYGERKRQLPQQSADEKAAGVPGPTRSMMELHTRQKEDHEHS